MRLWDNFEQLRAKAENLPVAEAVEKKGARFSRSDISHLQTAHDAIAQLADYVHCARGVNWQDSANNQPGDKPGEEEAGMLGPDIKTQKRGSRHSKADLADMKKVHDGCVAMGATCS